MKVLETNFSTSQGHHLSCLTMMMMMMMIVLKMLLQLTQTTWIVNMMPCISFRSVADTPQSSNFINMTSNQNSRRTHQSSQNLSKRLFQDVTNSPEVVFLGEKLFPQTVKKSCVKTEEIYNANIQLS